MLSTTCYRAGFDQSNSILSISLSCLVIYTDISLVKLVIKPDSLLLKNQRSKASSQGHHQTSPLFIIVIITCFLDHLNTYSPPIIPVISPVICHNFFPVYFLSFILYSNEFCALKEIFNHSHFPRSPTVCKSYLPLTPLFSVKVC